MTTWVLLRGWGRESRHWGEFPRRLGAALGSPVVMLDLPGNGGRHAERSPTHVAAAMEAARAAGASMGVHAPVNLLGLSLGAMACIEWAHRHPSEVSACVLLNTSARTVASFHERLRPSNYALAARALLAPGTHAGERAILRLTSANPAAHAAVVEDWVRFAREHPVSRANALRQLLSAARYTLPSRRPRAPMLVLAGGADTLVDPRCSERLARRWGLESAFAEGAGHDLTLDAGPWVARHVAEWIRRS